MHGVMHGGYTYRRDISETSRERYNKCGVLRAATEAAWRRSCLSLGGLRGGIQTVAPQPVFVVV